MSDTRAVSRDGCYEVQADPWEAFNSHWMGSPQIVEKATGTVGLMFGDKTWSLDGSR